MANPIAPAGGAPRRIIHDQVFIPGLPRVEIPGVRRLNPIPPIQFAPPAGQFRPPLTPQRSLQGRVYHLQHPPRVPRP